MEIYVYEILQTRVGKTSFTIIVGLLQGVLPLISFLYIENICINKYVTTCGPRESFSNIPSGFNIFITRFFL